MCAVMKFGVCIVLIFIRLGESIMIVGPNSIRSNCDYTLVISNVFGENRSDCLLTVRLEGIYYTGSTLLNLSQTVIVQQDANKMITFKVPDQSSYVTYIIKIEGKQPSTSSIVNIDQQVELKYRRSSVTGLIQLNKPVFRPDDILKLRVIIVDADLKPLPHGSRVSVYVFDPFDHIFREWTNVSLIGGILEAQIAIPTLPLLGTYHIVAMANDEFLTGKTIEVSDYELYSIGLNIFPTVVPLVQHQALNLTVQVKNDLGIPINGTMKVDLFLEKDKLDSFSTWDINGLRQVYLPFTDKLVGLEHTHDVLLIITFTEQHTNRTTTKQQRITVYNYKYKVTHNSRLTYRPGSPFTATLKITHPNDKPANNVTLLVQIGGPQELLVQNYTSNITGYINIFKHTNVSTKINNLQVFVGDHLKLNKTIYQPESASGMFMEVKLLTRAKVNRMVKLMVSCSHDMTILLYYVISKGNIVDAGFFRPNQMNRYPFQLLMSAKLIPRSRIVVATILNNKMILSAVDIIIEEFGNPLEIKIEENISEDGVDPGDEIELAIRGRPGAFVALTAYDQRLQQHMMNQYHDIFLGSIWDMFNRFHHDKEFDESDDVFKNTGLFAWFFADSITISIWNEYEHEYDSRGMYPEEPRFGMPEPYRTEFWESWLWQNVTIPPSGRIGLVVTVPHSTTTWCITGFSVDPGYVLESVKNPIQFSTKKIFYIVDHLPKSIKRGAIISLHFTLFSKISEAFEANVTMFNAKNHIQFVDRPTEDATVSTVIVPANSDARVSFRVRPMKLGELEIRLNASVMQGVISDSFRKILTVLPEDVWLVGSEDLHYSHTSYPRNTSFHIPLLIDGIVGKGCLESTSFLLPELTINILFINLNMSIHYGNTKQMKHIKSLIVFDNGTKLDPEVKNITMNAVLDNTRHFYVIITGKGKGVIKVNWRVYSCHSFKIEITKQATATKLLKELNVCCSFIPEITNQQSNGTVVEVSIPIGYAMDNHSVYEKTASNLFSRIEVLHDGTTVLVFYDRMGVDTNCFSIFAYKRFSMPVRRPSYVRVQDSHRPELNALKMFEFHSDRD